MGREFEFVGLMRGRVMEVPRRILHTLPDRIGRISLEERYWSGRSLHQDCGYSREGVGQGGGGVEVELAAVAWGKCRVH